MPSFHKKGLLQTVTADQGFVWLNRSYVKEGSKWQMVKRLKISLLLSLLKQNQRKKLS